MIRSMRIQLESLKTTAVEGYRQAIAVRDAAEGGVAAARRGANELEYAEAVVEARNAVAEVQKWEAIRSEVDKLTRLVG